MEDFEIWDPLENYEPFEPLETTDEPQIQHETMREKIKPLRGESEAHGFDELVRGLKNRVDLKTLSFIIRHKYEGVKKIMYDVGLDCTLKGISIEINNNEIYFKLNQDVKIT